jgi:SET domain-containing protein
MFDLDYDHVPIYSIDAEFYGNEAHFINHSCEPNLMAMAVYVDCIDAKLPRLSFFSTRDIKSGMYIDTHHKLLAFQGEQLCFDYRPSFNIQHQVYTVDDVSQVDDDADDDDVNEEGCERKTISAIEQHEICYCGAEKCRGRLIF